MKPSLIICLLFAALAAHTPVMGQYYRLRSIEGRDVKVHIEELPHQLRVSCLHDTLLLYEYFGEYHVRELDSSFLQITYAVRGGSGYGSGNTAILAVRDGRLRQALMVESSFESVNFNYHEKLHTDLKLTGNRWDNYVVTLVARDYLRDKGHPTGRLKVFQPMRVAFHKDLMAFYGKTIVSDSSFDAIEFNRSDEYMHFAARDTLPAIEFADARYYCVEGYWYSPLDAKSESQADTVRDKVLRLPIVEQKSAWIDSVTCHRHGISLVMLESADWPSDTGHYLLQVGYKSLQRFDPYYSFKVSQPDLAIMTVILCK